MTTPAQTKFPLFVVLLLVLVGCDSNDSSRTTSSSSATPVTPNAEASTMVLKGDVSEIYTQGRFVVFIPKPKSGSGSTTSMSSGASSMTAATSSKTSSAKSKEGSTTETSSTAAQPASTVTGVVPATDLFRTGNNVLAEATLQDDSTFSLTIPVQDPIPAYYYVLDGISKEGNRMGPVKGQQLIVEPGNLSLVMNARGRGVVHGGTYNDAVFNVWQTSEEYLSTYDEYLELLKPVPDETEEQRRQRVDAASAKHGEVLDIEQESRKNTSLTHPDPLVRKLTLQTAWLVGSWYRESLHRLAEVTPDDPWLIEKITAADELFAKRQAESKIGVGTVILDFEAETLKGDTITLSEIRDQSKIILVEFWASWCGPCRAEIPHMKSAYERFHEKGFEIVSFTIDDSFDDWFKASEEEELPWPNLGMGQDADPPTKYHITGVPHNYLVDAETGMILAKNLRGHHLDERLEKELL